MNEAPRFSVASLGSVKERGAPQASGPSRWPVRAHARSTDHDGEATAGETPKGSQRPAEASLARFAGEGRLGARGGLYGA